MKFKGKWMELENIILSEVTQSQKNTHSMHSLISGYLPKSSEYPRYKQFTDHMKLKKKEEKSVCVFQSFLEGGTKYSSKQIWR